MIKYAVIGAAVLLGIIVGAVILILNSIKKKRIVNIEENIELGRIKAEGVRKDYTITVYAKSGAGYEFSVSDGKICTYKRI